LEYNLKLSPSFLCDRVTNNNIPHLQIGFLKGIVVPSFDLLARLIPSLAYNIRNLNENLNLWEKLKEDEVVYESNERSSTIEVPFNIYYNSFK